MATTRTNNTNNTTATAVRLFKTALAAGRVTPDHVTNVVKAVSQAHNIIAVGRKENGMYVAWIAVSKTATKLVGIRPTATGVEIVVLDE